jgi:hypothetical protein
MLPETVTRRLEAIPTLVASGKRVNGLDRLMEAQLLWEQGLQKIASNDGAMTPGIDGETFLAFGPEDLPPLIASVTKGTYKPKPVRRVFIRKARANGVRLESPRATTVSFRRWHDNCSNESMSRCSQTPRMDFDRDTRATRLSNT